LRSGVPINYTDFFIPLSSDIYVCIGVMAPYFFSLGVSKQFMYYEVGLSSLHPTSSSSGEHWVASSSVFSSPICLYGMPCLYLRCRQ